MRRDKVHKLLGEVGDATVFEGLDCLPDDAVVMKYTCKSIQGMFCFTSRVRHPAKCPSLTDRTNCFIYSNDPDSRNANVAEVLSKPRARETTLGK